MMCPWRTIDGHRVLVQPGRRRRVRRWSQDVDLRGDMIAVVYGEPKRYRVSQPRKLRHAILNALVREDGYPKTMRRLGFARNVSGYPTVKVVLKSDMEWLRGQYRAENRVGGKRR